MTRDYPQLRLFDERWERYGNHYWRGYAWLNGVRWNPGLLGEDNDSPGPDQLNGCFCWIYYDPENSRFRVITDRLGSQPIYIGPDYITDRPGELSLNIEAHWLEENHWSYVEALPGTNTVYEKYFPVPLRTEIKEDHQTDQYPQSRSKVGNDDADFERVVMDSTRRLIKYAEGKKIIVLLSDGYDSRLVLAALCKLGYDNLLAVTYGIAGNGVVERARAIAERLGVAWSFIDYAEPEHADIMARDYPELVRLYANGTSVIQEQEIYACAKLRDLLAVECIIVPGICGDLQGGSYVPPYWFRWPGNRSEKTLQRWLLSRLTRYPVRSNAAERWMQVIKLRPPADRSERAAVAATEEVITFERVSKYTCTTLRVYEFYGFDWYLPQWDADFIAFWDQQPVGNRRFRLKYREWCKKIFFEPAGIHFVGEGETPRVSLGRLIRRFLPFGDRLAAGIPDPNRIAPMLEKLLDRKIGETEVNAALGTYLTEYYQKKKGQESK
ncbi:hypothetical protein CEQ90_09765 [Lewinellaceae bacterium SD302]|nr:hypothetical protein CEQ90_09765 [Lewinellaceae bacterium SD302]